MASTRPGSSGPPRRRKQTARSRRRLRPCPRSRWTPRSPRSRCRDSPHRGLSLKTRVLAARPCSTLDGRSGLGRIASVQEPLRNGLAPVVRTHLLNRGGDVVLGTAELELAVSAPDRPRGPRVAVERHSDAARVDKL